MVSNKDVPDVKIWKKLIVQVVSQLSWLLASVLDMFCIFDLELRANPNKFEWARPKFGLGLTTLFHMKNFGYGYTWYKNMEKTNYLQVVSPLSWLLASVVDMLCMRAERLVIRALTFVFLAFYIIDQVYFCEQWTTILNKLTLVPQSKQFYPQI